ncbi:NADH:flavorubredoxin reductase NorW [Ferrimonas sediminicola]|uniref:NADH:flavorubredoxin reductase NorW n=1 Tax=Ferrimonas sediminicola TaxID=2569538 RepID=A0A4U1BG85_9GAMM|nr:NADH:flavorubredoxin reductase NorW [Ferrimonas sediminicola]TKB50338.1 NADH:flavorubredoxin reductase NorW [Ferrimonas sediminicola]
MNAPIVIIGSGFAAYQLVKALRKIDATQPITVVTADDGHDYNKPDLSHVISRGQSAADLVKMTGAEFAEQQRITLLTRQTVEHIDPTQHRLRLGDQTLRYGQLVLATGARAMVPPIGGMAASDILTLNSLEEYQLHQRRLADARSVLVIGAGLIGTELAMDLASANKRVVLTDMAPQLLPRLLPEFVASRLYTCMDTLPVQLELATQVQGAELQDQGYLMSFANGHQHSVDAVVAAIGLRPNVQLARQAGLMVNQGIVVDNQLRTSASGVFALGDCAERDGQLQPYLQPTLLAANALAKTLLGHPCEVAQTVTLVKVKTPRLPIQLAGDTSRPDARWEVKVDADGMTASAFDGEQRLIGFVTTDLHMKNAFPLLRQLPVE